MRASPSTASRWPGGGSTLGCAPATRWRSMRIDVALGALAAGDLASRGAIGGTINYRTAPLGTAQNLTFGAGYDSDFGRAAARVADGGDGSRTASTP